MSPYVSDILESLLEATAERNAVRKHCLRMLEALDVPTRERLAPTAGYVGGKCMGYPAVWFLKRALGGDSVPVDSLVTLCEPALSISLTTSIVDDMVDADEIVAAEYGGFLYVLLAQAVYGVPGHGKAGRTAAADFLRRALEVCRDQSRSEEAPAARGDRIGHFYRMIATCAAERLPMPAGRRIVIVESAGRFGRCCAHLDDWLDAARDAEHGIRANVVLSGGTAAVSTDDGRAARIEALLGDELDAIGTLLPSRQTPALSQALGRVRRRLPGLLHADPVDAQHAQARAQA
jgi:hypothetical protein